MAVTLVEIIDDSKGNAAIGGSGSGALYAPHRSPRRHSSLSRCHEMVFVEITTE